MLGRIFILANLIFQNDFEPVSEFSSTLGRTSLLNLFNFPDR